MEEVWKDIENYNGIYQISNLGRVRKVKYYKKPKILSYHKTSKGYLRVSFCLNGKHKAIRIHRLVALAFIPNPENKPQVNHIDGNKENNSVNNLEWVTNIENINHAIAKGLSHIKPVALVVKGKPKYFFESIAKASKTLGIRYNAIYYSLNYCKHKHKTTKEVRWVYC